MILLPEAILQAYASVTARISVRDGSWLRPWSCYQVPLCLVLAALTAWPPLAAAVLGAATYGGFFAVLYLLAALIYRRDDALGMGDVKLAVVIGLMTGLPRSLVAMIAGIALGSVAAAAVMAMGRSGRSVMPYGTSLSVGAMLAILYGDLVIDWYMAP